MAPPQGLFGWVDVGVDTDALALRMHDAGYLLAPGSLFHADRRPGTLMRVNFASTQDDKFWRDLAKTRAELCRVEGVGNTLRFYKAQRFDNTSQRSIAANNNSSISVSRLKSCCANPGSRW